MANQRKPIVKKIHGFATSVTGYFFPERVQALKPCKYSFRTVTGKSPKITDFELVTIAGKGMGYSTADIRFYIDNQLVHSR
jgi:hypothetical protein